MPMTTTWGSDPMDHQLHPTYHPMEPNLYYIRLARPFRQWPPDAAPWGGYTEAAGSVQPCRYLIWPGKVQGSGVVATEWSFWSSADTDAAIIYSEADVAAVWAALGTTYYTRLREECPQWCPVEARP